MPQRRHSASDEEHGPTCRPVLWSRGILLLKQTKKKNKTSCHLQAGKEVTSFKCVGWREKHPHTSPNFIALLDRQLATEKRNYTQFLGLRLASPTRYSPPQEVIFLRCQHKQGSILAAWKPPQFPTAFGTSFARITDRSRAVPGTGAPPGARTPPRQSDPNARRHGIAFAVACRAARSLPRSDTGLRCRDTGPERAVAQFPPRRRLP